LELHWAGFTAIMQGMSTSSSEPGVLYDLAVIGGGIAGAGVARDAALRGLKVLLLEKRTFGSGTSSTSSKLIHGGIRYLELAWKAFLRGRLDRAWKDLRFVFASLRESRILERIAPEWVRPLPLLVPCYAGDSRRPASIRAGAWIYWTLAALSGSGVRTPQWLEGAEAVRTALPGLKTDGLRGAIRIWDRCTDDVALVRATIDSAVRAGGRCLEHAEVVSYRNEGGRFEITARRQDGTLQRFYSRKMVDAGGPWVDKIRLEAGGLKESAGRYLLTVAGSHIELPRFLPESVILQARDGRVFFAIDRGERTRVGTTEWAWEDPDSVKVPDSDVEYLLDSLRRYFPETRFDKRDILTADAGVRPLAFETDSRGGANEVSREHAIRTDPDGVLHLIGVKLTDHRRAAEDLVNRVAPGTRSRTARLPLGSGRAGSSGH